MSERTHVSLVSVPIKRRSTVGILLALVAAIVIAGGPDRSIAAGKPIFRMPVNCAMPFKVTTRANHSPSIYAADLNWGTTDDDLGLPVLASAAGIIYARGTGPGSYGNRVVINHGGGWYTLYAHLNGIDSAIQVGVKVGQGAHLGSLGNSGGVDTHLHVEQRYGSTFDTSTVQKFTINNTVYEYPYGMTLASTNCGRGLQFDEVRNNDVFKATGSATYYNPGGDSALWTQLATTSATVDILEFADFNANGKTDVFKGDGANWSVLYEGKAPWVPINSASHRAGDIVVGDFDGDSKADVFYANGVKWYVSWGGKTAYDEINTSSAPLSTLGFADFDGDGKTDVFNATGSEWKVSYGGQTAWQHLNYAAARITDVDFGDFNRDGRDDVLYADGTYWRISWAGTSAYQLVNTSAATLGAMEFSDLDGAGDSDAFRPDGNVWYISKRAQTSWTVHNVKTEQFNVLALNTRDRA